jgi:hypothetical protein
LVTFDQGITMNVVTIPKMPSSTTIAPNASTSHPALHARLD